MALYQFLIAVRTSGPGLYIRRFVSTFLVKLIFFFFSGGGQAAMMLTNESGEVTSHIQGMFNRTIKMMSSGIRPVYVFDGKPPQMKGGELAKRMAKRAKAEVDLAAAKEGGDIEDVDKFSRRLVKVTRQQNDDCKQLLRLMGVPYVDAPCEAEAQCAELARSGKVYATATEDMDALTFRTPKLLRRLTFSQGKDKQTILEVDFDTVLRGLQLTIEQFVDLCILCGCDYCSTIKGIGPKIGLRMIQAHKTIEGVIKAIKREKKFDLPPDWVVMRVPKAALVAEETAEEKEEIVEKAEKVEVTGIEAVVAPSESVLEEPSDGDMERLDMKPAATSAGAGAGGGSGSAEVDEDDDFGGAFVDNDSGDEEEEEEEDAEGGAEAKPEAEASEMNDEEDETNAGGGAEKAVADLTSEDGGEFEIVPPLYEQARRLFLQHEVLAGEDVDLRWTEPDVEGLRAFLVEKFSFNLERVNTGIKRLQDAQQKKSQKRMDWYALIVDFLLLRF
jgi:flap endonuclease-1